VDSGESFRSRKESRSRGCKAQLDLYIVVIGRLSTAGLRWLETIRVWYFVKVDG
jgi:hypothetical protein